MKLPTAFLPPLLAFPLLVACSSSSSTTTHEPDAEVKSDDAGSGKPKDAAKPEDARKPVKEAAVEAGQLDCQVCFGQSIQASCQASSVKCQDDPKCDPIVGCVEKCFDQGLDCVENCEATSTQATISEFQPIVDCICSSAGCASACATQCAGN